MNLNTDFPVEVFKTDRIKTASIKIVEGRVHVVVPKRLSDARVNDLILKRTTWIKQKLRIQSETVHPKPKEYVSGENFTYLGRNYRLKLIPNGEEEVKLKGGYLTLGYPNKLSETDRQSFVKDSLVDWYKRHALKRLTEKSKRYGEILRVIPKSISLKNYKSKWGSCSDTGEIFFNWKVIIAPHHIVDYVVVHELCHMLEHNHSPKYWRHVQSVILDYKMERQWLKVNGLGLFV
jgi:predicted metal-dependent hydrolase